MIRWRFCCILMLLSISIQSQRVVKRQYATNDYTRLIKSQDADYAQKQSQLNKHFRRFNKYGNVSAKHLPVIFHVMYTQDTTTAIRLIASQLEALNRDFSFAEKERVHSRFARLGADSQIQFYPATTREQALTGSGISTVSDYGSFSAFDEMKKNRTGGVDAWDTDKYINVWVVMMSGDLKSYAQFPIGPTTTDGILIDYRCFGQAGSRQYPYNEGKTLTHLIGSYLGLIELWGESRCEDDGVDDTPIHNAPNIGQFGGVYTSTGSGSAPISRDLLREDYPIHQHISVCGNHPEEMTVNFMDATHDASQAMFTRGQIKRMHAILSTGGPRAILSSQNQQR